LTDRITGDHPVTAGSWHTMKLHIDTVGTTAGMQMYIDGVEITGDPTLSLGESVNATMNSLEMDYTGDPIFQAQNTNIFLDSIGVYVSDPAANPDV